MNINSLTFIKQKKKRKKEEKEKMNPARETGHHQNKRAVVRRPDGSSVILSFDFRIFRSCSVHASRPRLTALCHAQLLSPDWA